MRRHQRIGELPCVGWREFRERGWQQLAVHSDEGHIARLQVDVTRAPLNRVPQ
jgi:hypothetical protein